MPGGARRPLWPQQRLRLHLLRDHRGCLGGQEGDGRQGAGREADQGGLLHHEEAAHPDTGQIHGPALQVIIASKWSNILPTSLSMAKNAETRLSLIDASGTLMDSVEAGAAAVGTFAEDGEDIASPDLATMIGAETDTETIGDTTRIGRGTDTTRTGGEMTGITREAAGAGPAAGDILTREDIRMRGGMTHTLPLPRTGSAPGGESIFKYVNNVVKIVFSQGPPVHMRGNPDQEGSTDPDPESTREDTKRPMMSKPHVMKIMSYDILIFDHRNIVM